MLIFDIVKQKTNIVGYWKDDKNKVYKDNIVLFDTVKQFEVDAKLQQLFLKGEKAVFIKTDNCAFIYHSNVFQLPDCLSVKHSLFVNKGKYTMLKNAFKLFFEYGGFTVYKSNKGYTFESWTK